MRRYAFKVTLQGNGNTPEEAWKDAVCSLLIAEIPPTVRTVEEVHSYTDFARALEDLHKNGGALTHTSPTKTSPVTWHVWGGKDLYAYLKKQKSKLSIRECTRTALKMGGLTPEEIDNEMNAFID